MATNGNKVSGDLLFWFQLVMAWAFTAPQAIRLFSSTQGMTITWAMFCSAFTLINLFLALGAYRQSKSRKAGQVVFVYANWLLLWSALFVIICIKGSWFAKDTILSALILAALAAVLAVRRRESLAATISEPITRGIVALLLKSVPQLFVGYCIISAGKKDGLAGLTLLIGHITVCSRLLEIFLAAKQDGWNLKNQGMLISESGNEISWLVTTGIWLRY